MMEQPGAFSPAAHPLSPGAGSVIVHEQRVLLVRNRYGVTRGRYLLPAGRVRAGAIARKGLEVSGSRWRHHGELADTPGWDAAGRWRMWL